MADDKDREQRIDDGRQAFAVMMQGVREMGSSMLALAQSNTVLAQSNNALAARVGALVAKNDELIVALRGAMEHNAALQAQIGVLVKLQGAVHGVPIVAGAPPPLAPSRVPDPVSRLGQRVVNGFMGRHPAGPPGP